MGALRFAFHGRRTVLRRVRHLYTQVGGRLYLYKRSLRLYAFVFIFVGCQCDFCVSSLVLSTMFTCTCWFFGSNHLTYTIVIFHCRPTTNSIMALTFAKYVIQPFFPECEMPDLGVRLVAAAVICRFNVVRDQTL